LLARRATLGNAELRLTQREFALLVELMRQPGAALSRDQLLERVWGRGATSPHSVNVYLHALRQKIEAEPSRPTRIITVVGLGYRLDGVAD
jgi:DNA-binding response OmpR family regulator